MSRLTRELALIDIVLAVTALACLFVRRSGGSRPENAERVPTGILGAFVLLGGTAKFFEPSTTMFAEQIAPSGLPSPTPAAFAGRAGEISSGLVLLGSIGRTGTTAPTLRKLQP